MPTRVSGSHKNLVQSCQGLAVVLPERFCYAGAV